MVQYIVMGGGDLDQFVPRREWPDKPLPEVPEFPRPAPSRFQLLPVQVELS